MMERLGDSLGEELRRFGATGSMPAVVAAWPGAVGDEVARNAWPARISRDGVLHVNTSSSAWAFELTQLAAVVLKQLAAGLDDDAPKGLRFAPGHLPEPAPLPAEETASRVAQPSPEQLAEAQELASPIADDELRERVARAAALSLATARSDRRF
jgi:predicted nucleic acid-binding Zn ribbon protein